MASFFELHKPSKMLDMKKKLGLGLADFNEQSSSGSGGGGGGPAMESVLLQNITGAIPPPPLSSAPPSAPVSSSHHALVSHHSSSSGARTPPSLPAQQAAMQSACESWIELAPSRGSLCSSVDPTIVMVDALAANTRDSRLSPVSLQSPCGELENSLEQVKVKLARDMKQNSDWLYDWSSRPEAVQPKSIRMRQYGSNLTTPPNSPCPELLAAFPIETVVGEGEDAHPHRAVRPFGFSIHVLFGIFMSNIVTFVIGAAIGFCVCKRIARHQKHI